MRYLFPKIVGFFKDDHSVYLDVKNIPGKRQSILIDCGNNHTLQVKDFIRISTVMLSHAHIDHFIGFDNIIRMNLRENKRITVIGPAPVSSILHHRLQGYIWNLIYDSSFEVEVWDIYPRSIKKYLFKCCEKFAKKYFLGQVPVENNTLINNAYYECRYVRLYHDIPTIGYSFREKDHIKLDKKKLEALNLSEGKWIKNLKARQFSPDETITDGNGKVWSMQELYGHLISCQKGFKLSYITDTVLNPLLEKKILSLIAQSDELYCESTFLHKDIKLAQTYYHLTAKQTGHLAKQAGVKKLFLIHLSLRYSNPQVLLKEARNEFPHAVFPRFPEKCSMTRKI